MAKQAKEWWQVGPYRHRGVAYYDAQRMKQPLQEIIHHGEWKGYDAPPSWITLPAGWEWPLKYEHGENAAPAVDSELSNESLGYTLEPCDVQTVAHYRIWNHAQTKYTTEKRPCHYTYELKFEDGAKFLFVSESIALAALPEIIKARKPMRRGGRVQHSSENSSVFFTENKLQKLAG